MLSVFFGKNFKQILPLSAHTESPPPGLEGMSGGQGNMGVQAVRRLERGMFNSNKET